MQTVERLVDWGLTSHQQLRSYGDGASVYSPIRRTGEPATPGLQGEWHNHCTTKASQAVEKRNTAVMKAAKCVNCSGPHPTFSHDCPIWHKEKELLKIKYTRNLAFFEAPKIVEQQSSTTNKNYASIIKSAGTHVKLVDAMTQTDETYDVQIRKHKNPGGDAPSGTNQTAGGKVSPALAGGNPPPVQSCWRKPLPPSKPHSAKEKTGASVRENTYRG